jgi:hypothetical protein
LHIFLGTIKRVIKKRMWYKWLWQEQKIQ